MRFPVTESTRANAPVIAASSSKFPPMYVTPPCGTITLMPPFPSMPNAVWLGVLDGLKLGMLGGVLVPPPQLASSRTRTVAPSNRIPALLMAPSHGRGAPAANSMNLTRPIFPFGPRERQRQSNYVAGLQPFGSNSPIARPVLVGDKGKQNGLYW